jgi:hypothetical protein
LAISERALSERHEGATFDTDNLRSKGHEGIGREEPGAGHVAFFILDQHQFKPVKAPVRKRVCVIDGQGGGIGSTVIKYLRTAHGESIELIALGTNAIAASQMLRAGANRCASGENAICHTTESVECIIGPVSITWANAMLGEVTPRMAEAVTSSQAVKLLLPLFQENAEIVGVVSEPLPHLVQELVEKRLKEVLNHV